MISCILSLYTWLIISSSSKDIPNSRKRKIYVIVYEVHESFILYIIIGK